MSLDGTAGPPVLLACCWGTGLAIPVAGLPSFGPEDPHCVPTTTAAATTKPTPPTTMRMITPALSPSSSSGAGDGGAGGDGGDAPVTAICAAVTAAAVLILRELSVTPEVANALKTVDTASVSPLAAGATENTTITEPLATLDRDLIRGHAKYRTHISSKFRLER